ncbi:unnamed protein product [Urochloa humidicola]
MAVAVPGQLNLDKSPSWGSCSVDCFEKLEQTGEATVSTSVHLSVRIFDMEGTQEDQDGQRVRGFPYHGHPRDQNPQEAAPRQRHQSKRDRHFARFDKNITN